MTYKKTRSLIFRIHRSRSLPIKMYGICQVSDFSYTPEVLQNLQAFYKVSDIACSSGRAAGLTKGAGLVAAVLRRLFSRLVSSCASESAISV